MVHVGVVRTNIKSLQWIKIDLQNLRVVTGLVIQGNGGCRTLDTGTRGRCYNQQSHSCCGATPMSVTSFKMSFSHDDVNWTPTQLIPGEDAIFETKLGSPGAHRDSFSVIGRVLPRPKQTILETAPSFRRKGPPKKRKSKKRKSNGPPQRIIRRHSSRRNSRHYRPRQRVRRKRRRVRRNYRTRRHARRIPRRGRCADWSSWSKPYTQRIAVRKYKSRCAFWKAAGSCRYRSVARWCSRSVISRPLQRSRSCRGRWS
jgi:hypothetical protein